MNSRSCGRQDGFADVRNPISLGKCRKGSQAGHVLMRNTTRNEAELQMDERRRVGSAKIRRRVEAGPVLNTSVRIMDGADEEANGENDNMKSEQRECECVSSQTG